MANVTPGFELICDAVNARFTLTEVGENWRKAFDSFAEAYEHAEARATGKTALRVCNEHGQFIIEATIWPLSVELTAARDHWRNLAALSD